MPATTNPNQKFMGAETSQTRNPSDGMGKDMNQRNKRPLRELEQTIYSVNKQLNQ